MNEEAWILHYLTGFTFAVIFFFWYVRRRLTYFERRRLNHASIPKFPFGNVNDVVFLNTPFFMQLWKFYLRFKKRKYAHGGFFICLRPAYMAVDPPLIHTLLESPSFVNFHPKTDFPIGENAAKIVRKLAEVMSGAWPSIEEFFRGEEVNFTVVMNQYVKTISGEFLGAIEDEKFRNIIHDTFIKKRKTDNFKNLLQFGAPVLSKLFAGDARTNEAFFIDQVNVIVGNRKKNDVKCDDLIAFLSKLTFNEPKDIGKFIYSLVDRLKVATNLVLFALFELALNQEMQEDLRGEILRFQKKKSGKFNEITDLDYLETIVCETLRKYPVAPYMAKIAIEKSGNFEMGDLVFLSIFGMHHDPENYTRADKFDPDRFSQENFHFIDPEKYHPCATSNKDFDLLYIKTIIKVSLIELLGNFKLSLGKKTIKSLVFDESVLEIKPKNDIWLKIEK